MMEISALKIDERFERLSDAAKKLGWQTIASELVRKGFFGCYSTCLRYSIEEKRIVASGYGFPKTVIQFCGLLEKEYARPVELTFCGDEEVSTSIYHWLP